MRIKPYDLTYYKYFGIKTPTKYTHTPILPVSINQDLQKSWEQHLKTQQVSPFNTLVNLTINSLLTDLNEDNDPIITNNMIFIKWINQSIGYGVFANQYIPAHTILGMYTGLYIDLSSYNLSESSYIYKLNHKSTNDKTPFDKYIVDAQSHGNWTRFVNHSIPKHNNIITTLYLAQSAPIIIFSSGHEGIPKNHQLLYDYGKDYWNNRTKKILTPM